MPSWENARLLDEVFNQQYLALRLTFIASRTALVQGLPGKRALSCTVALVGYYGVLFAAHRLLSIKTRIVNKLDISIHN